MAGRIATQEELLQLMLELQEEMPDGPKATYSPEELREFATDNAEQHRQYMEDNLWMLGLPAVMKQAGALGGAISDGAQRVMNSSNVAKDFLWPRRLRNLDLSMGHLFGHAGLSSHLSGADNGFTQDPTVKGLFSDLLDMMEDLRLRR